MSAEICGKRLGFEEIFGSPSSAPSAKRPRCSRYGSPISTPDFGFVSEDKVSILLRVFPSMDREVVETVLAAHDHNIDDAIKSLHALCLGEASVRHEMLGQNPVVALNGHSVEGSLNTQKSEQTVEDLHENNSNLDPGVAQSGSCWVDTFVQEMNKASNWDDIRVHATKILEAFERSIITNSRASEEQEITLLKEQLQYILRENEILKRAVAIQHEPNMEHENRLKEVQELKHMINQYQEQVRRLEEEQLHIENPSAEGAGDQLDSKPFSPRCILRNSSLCGMFIWGKEERREKNRDSSVKFFYLGGVQHI